MASTGSGDPLVFSSLVNRQVRVGDIVDQCRSTWDKIGEALEERRADEALALAEFAVEQECRFVYDILTGWATEIRALLARRGVAEGDLVQIDERLKVLLAYPDGEPYRPTPAGGVSRRRSGAFKAGSRRARGTRPRPPSLRCASPGEFSTIASSTRASAG